VRSTARGPRLLHVTEDKSTRYHRLRRRASLAAAVAGDLVLLLLVVSGAAVRLREGVQAVSGTLLPAGFDEAATVVLLTLLVIFLLQVVELPFSWYQGFSLEHRYGLSMQTPGHWMKDYAKAGVLAALVAAVAASVVFFTLRQWSEWWWIISAAVFSVALVATVQLAPVLLLPVFYRLRPLDRPALVTRVTALASRARTKVVGVFEWVLSDHTRKANAALAGLGRTRRILLSDTLLADFSDDEIEVVLAHEFAHHVHRDLWRGIVAYTVIVTSGFFLADVFLRGAPERLGLRGLSDPASIPLLVLVGTIWLSLMLPAVNALSRAQERAADRYALETTRNPDAFVSAMKRLSQQNMAEDEPSPLVQALFYSHPPIRERIAAARAFTRT
jgi:STE24 endopeptidase